MQADQKHGDNAAPNRIKLLISDVDGTLVTPDKVVTDATVEAVEHLRQQGVAFTIISSRPPRGMLSVIKALNIAQPFGAFNGGSILSPDMRVLSAHRLAAQVAHEALSILDQNGVDAWVFADDAWFLRNLQGPNVERERHTVSFDPTLVAHFDTMMDRIDKIVGVSNDHAHLAAVEQHMQMSLGDRAQATRSQPYYLDITHPLANKGNGVEALSAALNIGLKETAVIGDMANDIAMFRVAGLSVAMGQAPENVRAAASLVTRSNVQDGVAHAIQTIILPHALEANG